MRAQRATADLGMGDGELRNGESELTRRSKTLDEFSVVARSVVALRPQTLQSYCARSRLVDWCNLSSLIVKESSVASSER